MFHVQHFDFEPHTYIVEGFGILEKHLLLFSTALQQ